MRPICAGICLVFGGVGLYVLGTAMLQGAPKEGSTASSSLHSGRSGSTKPTWHGGPPSTPPELEAVPLPPAVPPPAKSLILGPQKERDKPASEHAGVASSAGSVTPTKRASPTADEPAPVVNADPHQYTNSPDPEALRIRDELKRLHNDSDARRTFYDDLRHTVERVRAGMRDEDSPERNAAPSQWVSPRSHDTSSESTDPAASNEPYESKPSDPGPPQASLGTRGGKIDHAAYLRVVRWAKANGAPVGLALGVAWIESQLHTDPARGAAGEVGMFQIMPARCKIEGWPPKRLKEPEFNAWLGTRLLARYYQEEGSWARAAAKYVAGPAVFDKSYSKEVWNYINEYASSVDSYAGYFSRYEG